jgi:hypothetical protein
MKYILILGKDYRDCKAKLESIVKEADTNYGFVTKLKHLNGVPFETMLIADNAQQNPNYKAIFKLARKSGIGMVVDPTQLAEAMTPTPVVAEEPVVKKKKKKKKVVAEEPVVKEDDVDWRSDENFPVEPIDIDKDFEKELEELIEMDEDVKEEEPVVEEELVIEEEPVLPPLVEVVNEPVEDIPVDVPVADHVEELVVDVPEPVAEEVPEPVVEEVPDEMKKPVNPPRGWHARKEFIDDAGNIFNKGQYVGNTNG